MKTDTERLVDDIVHVEGWNVRGRRVAIAQAHLDTQRELVMRAGVAAGVELHTRLARYRTALVTLVALVTRVGGYMAHEDQNLVRQIKALLDEDVAE